MRSHRVTLRDVAERVGLSVNTVSRALAGKDQVSETTREAIQREARRLGYVPNSHARSLASGTTTVVGLVITNPSNPFYAALISTVESRCRANGYSVLLLVTEESDENEERAVGQLLRFGVDGVLAVPTQGRIGAWEPLADAKIPVVLLSRDLPESGFDLVGIDAERGLADAVRRVAGAGVRRAWLFEEDLRISTTAARVAGFQQAVEQVGGAVDSLVLTVPTRRTRGSTPPWRPDDAYRMAANLITRQNFPDLVVAGNDYFALGILKAMREIGLRVPDDVRLLGYGDHPFAGYLDPALTSLRLPADDAASAAVDLLVRRIADPARARQAVLLRPTLVERASTRPAGG